MKMSPRPLLATVCCFSVVLGSSGKIFNVTDTRDAGPGTFRQALLDANASPGHDTIRFDLPGNGVRTIAPLAPLPEVTNSVVIDAYSQPGSRTNSLEAGNDSLLLVRLDGLWITNGFPAGLVLRADNCSVRGLIIVRFSYGIQIDSGKGCVLAGNWIGLDWDNIARGMDFDGITVSCPVFASASGNVIGGAGPGDRNLIAGNRVGVSFFPAQAGNNSVMGNWLGTDRTGKLPRGNLFAGVKIQAATNITVSGNVLAAATGAGGCGVSLNGGSGHVIQNNRIGHAVDLEADLGNSAYGVFAQGATHLRIGGTNAVARNDIGFNRSHGIFLQGCSGAAIEGNSIGANASGNGGCGIYLTSSSTNRISRNEIVFNTKAGIGIASGSGNELTGNSIYDNGDLGIDLGDDGPTDNDAGDADTGANDLLNHPELISGTLAGGTLSVQGILNSLPDLTFRIEFYASDAWDPLWIPEGRVFLGAARVTTDFTGSVGINFSTAFNAFSVEQLITALSIDPWGNTSEFSPSLALTGTPAPPRLTVQMTGNMCTVAWPASTTDNYVLESSVVLIPSAFWTRVGLPVQNNGSIKYVLWENPAGEGCRFFRLKQQ